MALSPLGHDWAKLLLQAEAILLRDLNNVPGPRLATDKLCVLLDQVATWTRRVDLTAARSPEELVDLFLADARVLATFTSSSRWVDVGSGGGAPGLVLALLCPSLALTLVEPRAKRVAFLRNALAVLDITSAQVVRGRSDTLATGSFDTAVSRATLPPPEWLVEGARLAGREVWVLLAQGAAPEHDGWNIDRDVEYRWPLTGASRRAVRYVRKGPE
jgi:16S rRNA (guanine527-N7)-methyltransferase